MHTVVLNIEDSVFDKVIYFLKNLPSNEVNIVEDKIREEIKSRIEAIDKDEEVLTLYSQGMDEMLARLQRKIA